MYSLMTKIDKLLSIIPALWASLFDIAITAIHQSSEYWSGDLSQANEGNPIGAYFMSKHVAGMFVISGLWLVVIVLLGYFLPRQIRKVFLLFCVIAHSYGASTWLSNRYGFWYMIVFILFNSILYSVVDDFVGRKNSAFRR